MRFIYSILFVMLINFQVSAQNSLEVTLEQEVSGNYLLVDIYAKATGDDFLLGGCNLPFTDNGSSLDLSNAILVDSMNGKFSGTMTPDSYKGPYLKYVENFAHVYFVRNMSGSGQGEYITQVKERITRIAIPILDQCGTTELEWVNRGTLSTFDRERIKDNSSLVNPGLFYLTEPIAKPIIVEVDGKLEASFAPSYQWYFNGKAIPEETSQSITLEREGEYTVETSNGCMTQVSDVFNHSETGPKLEISAAPNPYTDYTTITYNLPDYAVVNVTVYDVVGNQIETLVNANQSKGQYSLSFSAQEIGYTSGIYFVKLRVGDQVKTQRIVELNSN